MSRTQWTLLVILMASWGAATSPAQQNASMLITAPNFSFYKDPPSFYTTILSGGAVRLVRVGFNRFGVGVRIIPDSTITLGSGSAAKPRVRSEQALDRPDESGHNIALDPDPDEHFMCPDLWPDPDDEFPLPDPPLPMPDYPDEDPFDGLPEPPPFEPDDLMTTNLNDGTVTVVTPGGAGSNTRPMSSAPRQSTVVTIRVGLGPAAIALTPDKQTALVTNSGSGTISVIQKRAVVATINLPAGAEPDGIAITPDGKFAYVTNFQPQGASVFVIDIASRTVTATIPADPFPAVVQITPDGTQAWITSIFGNSVTIVDVLTNKIVGRQFPIQAAWGIAFNPTGTRAYVASSTFGQGNLVVIDTKTYRILATIPVGPSPRDVAVSPSGGHVFVTNPDADFISQIDARTNKLVRNITVGANPLGLSFAH